MFPPDTVCILLLATGKKYFKTEIKLKPLKSTGLISSQNSKNSILNYQFILTPP